MIRSVIVASVSVLTFCDAQAGIAQDAVTMDMSKGEEHAAATLEQMTLAEKTVLTHGIMALPISLDVPVPPEAGTPRRAWQAKFRHLRELSAPGTTKSTAFLMDYADGAVQIVVRRA